MQQLFDYPNLYSLCYVPISLVMIIDIFNHRKKSLPSTSTELYQLFAVMVLAREKGRIKLVSTTVTVTDDVKQVCCKALPEIPKETIGKLILLSKLAYLGFFERNPDSSMNHDGWRKVSKPRIIFKEDDLKQCNIKTTDGEGLLTAVTLHHLYGDCVTYNFVHLTVQEFLCAIFMLTLSQEEQYHLLKEYFDIYPNIMIFYCGLTRLDFHQIVFPKLTLYSSTMTAMKCLYEGQRNTVPDKAKFPSTLDISYITLMPYDCLCLSYVYCQYPVTTLKLYMCYIGDNAGLLAKWCMNKNTTTKLQEIDLADNILTSTGMKHVMNMVTSEPQNHMLLINTVIITGSPSLRLLDISENDIGDDGILSCVHHINTLTRLSLEFCGISAEGIVSIVHNRAYNLTGFTNTLHLCMH